MDMTVAPAVITTKVIVSIGIGSYSVVLVLLYEVYYCSIEASGELLLERTAPPLRILPVGLLRPWHTVLKGFSLELQPLLWDRLLGIRVGRLPVCAVVKI